MPKCAKSGQKPGTKSGRIRIRILDIRPDPDPDPDIRSIANYCELLTYLLLIDYLRFKKERFDPILLWPCLPNRTNWLGTYRITSKVFNSSKILLVVKKYV